MSGASPPRKARLIRSGYLSLTWTVRLMLIFGFFCWKSLISFSSHGSWLTYQSQWLAVVLPGAASSDEEPQADSAEVSAAPPTAAVAARKPRLLSGDMGSLRSVLERRVVDEEVAGAGRG